MKQYLKYKYISNTGRLPRFNGGDNVWPWAAEYNNRYNSAWQGAHVADNVGGVDYSNIGYESPYDIQGPQTQKLTGPTGAQMIGGAIGGYAGGYLGSKAGKLIGGNSDTGRVMSGVGSMVGSQIGLNVGLKLVQQGVESLAKKTGSKMLGKLATQAGSKALGVGLGAVAAIPAAIDLTKTTASMWDASFNQNQIDQMTVGSSDLNINGRTINLQENNLDAHALEHAQNVQKTMGIVSAAGSGASIGSAFGPVGTLIGGAAGALIGFGGKILGGSHARRKLRRRIRSANNLAFQNNYYTNTQRIQSAQTDALREGINEQNTQDDTLFANANHGIDRHG